MKVLITDTETNGLSPKDSQIIELAFILYDTQSKTELLQASTLVHADSNPCEKINGISPEALESNSTNFTWFSPVFRKAVETCDAVVAHNASFDRAFIEANFWFAPIVQKPWVCSMNHLKFPRQGKSKKLTHIASDHGINPTGAHRALFDCQLLVQLFKQTLDLEEQIKRILSTKTYSAVFPYDQRNIPKEAGMTWDKEKKLWIGRFTEEGASRLHFKVALYE